ncbi:hypothetical protein TNCV_3099071 [Trichonephila clavipes]|nr:hypothetical protein TNCV_3099071 [Trichonephila clavipes]
MWNIPSVETVKILASLLRSTNAKILWNVALRDWDYPVRDLIQRTIGLGGISPGGGQENTSIGYSHGWQKVNKMPSVDQQEEVQTLKLWQILFP